MTDLPDTLTEAQHRSGVILTHLRSDATLSNARAIPYSEQFRGYTGLLTSPVDHLQETIEEAEAQGSEAQ